VGPGTRGGWTKKAEPGNEVVGPVRRPLNVKRQHVDGAVNSIGIRFFGR